MPWEYKPIRMSRLDYKVREAYYSAARISLCQEPEGQPGRDYLLWERGFDWDTIANFRLGYVPPFTGTSFDGRIIMPIFDVYDNLLCLSARPATSDKEILKAVGKYWNESFPKGEHLYGLNLAKYAIAKAGFAIVVEGQPDVMGMHSYGFKNTVGVLGGAFTPFHALLLKRWCDQIVILMDGDEAGQRHVKKCRETLDVFSFTSISPGGKAQREPRLKYCVIPLPLIGNNARGEPIKDPDEACRSKGASKVREFIETHMADDFLTVPKDWFAAA